MIDALYPIMGGMISKYVTQAIKEMMETINHKIESGLSIERYKRKIKAKLTGVSESELLLEESADAQLLAMFIIHKESGLLIAEAHLEESQIDDVHMVASMASAIKDFINDWIAGHQESSKEVQILSYGDATLYIEGAGSVYMVAFLDSEPDYEQRSEITAFFSSLLEKYSGFFQHFDGDLSAKEIAQLEKRMADYLRENEPKHISNASQKEQKSIKYLLFFMMLAALGYAIYMGLERYTLHQIESRITQETGEKLNVEKKENRLIVQGVLNDPSHYDKVISLAEENSFGASVESKLLLTVKGAQNYHRAFMQQLLQTQRTALGKQHAFYTNNYQQTAHKIAELEKKLSVLQQSIEGLHDKEQKLVSLIDLKNKIHKALLTSCQNNPYYQPDTDTLNFASLHLFEENKVTPPQEKVQKVIESTRTYLKALLPYLPYIQSIEILSYSDSLGNAAHNLELTQARAAYIKERIVEQTDLSPLFPLLRAEGKGESALVMRDGIEDHEASRRVIIRYHIDQKKVDTALDQLIQYPAKGMH